MSGRRWIRIRRVAVNELHGQHTDVTLKLLQVLLQLLDLGLLRQDGLLVRLLLPVHWLGLLELLGQ